LEDDMVRTISLEDARGRELFQGVSLLRSDPPPPGARDEAADREEASESSGVRLRSDVGLDGKPDQSST
jgi:hypothetical protein